MSNPQNHSVIILSGLGDKVKLLKIVCEKRFLKHGYTPIFCAFPWDNSETFDVCFERLKNVIALELAKRNIVSLIGISAGGSALINAFCEMPEKINAVITVCSRIRIDDLKNEIPLENLKFDKSVRQSELNLEKLDPKYLEKIMTIRAFYDDLVPDKLVAIAGALNIRLPIVEHLLGIFFALNFYFFKIDNFLQKKVQL